MAHASWTHPLQEESCRVAAAPALTAPLGIALVPPQVTVMLISLKAGGVGLNLVSANHVVILDPW